MESRQALKQSINLDDCPIVLYEDLPQILPNFDKMDSKYTTFLIDAIFSENTKTVEDSLEVVKKFLIQVKDLEQVKSFVVNTAFIIYDSYKKIIDYTLPSDMHDSFHKLVSKCENANECFELLSEISKSMADKIFMYNNDQIKFKLIAATEFIENNYEKQINRNDIAEHIGLSNCYVSSLFKKELNTTITEYIANVRIEAAKRMLKEGKKKIYEIATETGFSDVYYFSKIFKKITGENPSDWRAHNLEV
jgi:YesN/AraC family two-component response regulator